MCAILYYRWKELSYCRLLVNQAKRYPNYGSGIIGWIYIALARFPRSFYVQLNTFLPCFSEADFRTLIVSLIRRRDVKGVVSRALLSVLDPSHLETVLECE